MRTVGNDVEGSSAVYRREPQLAATIYLQENLPGNFNRVNSPVGNFLAAVSAAQSADFNRNVREKFRVGTDVMEFAPKSHVNAAGTSRDNFAEFFRVAVD